MTLWMGNIPTGESGANNSATLALPWDGGCNCGCGRCPVSDNRYDVAGSRAAALWTTCAESTGGGTIPDTFRILLRGLTLGAGWKTFTNGNDGDTDQDAHDRTFFAFRRWLVDMLAGGEIPLKVIRTNGANSGHYENIYHVGSCFSSYEAGPPYGDATPINSVSEILWKVELDLYELRADLESGAAVESALETADTRLSRLKITSRAANGGQETVIFDSAWFPTCTMLEPVDAGFHGPIENQVTASGSMVAYNNAAGGPGPAGTHAAVHQGGGVAYIRACAGNTGDVVDDYYEDHFGNLLDGESPDDDNFGLTPRVEWTVQAQYDSGCLSLPVSTPGPGAEIKYLSDVFSMTIGVGDPVPASAVVGTDNSALYLHKPGGLPSFAPRGEQLTFSYAIGDPFLPVYEVYSPTCTGLDTGASGTWRAISLRVYVFGVLLTFRGEESIAAGVAYTWAGDIVADVGVASGQVIGDFTLTGTISYA